jgi:hypothetical protein
LVTSNRLPGWGQIARVYAISVLLIYGWTILWFFWKLPAWLHFLNAGEITTVLVYALGTSLVESIIAVCLPLALALVLPIQWFSQVFVARGAALMLAALGSLMAVAFQFENREELPAMLRAVWPMLLIVLGIGVLVHLAGRISILRHALELIADRATIFLYVTVPLSALALLVLAARWLR